MADESVGRTRDCRLCGGAMERTGIERVGRDVTSLGRGPTPQSLQEQLACQSCKTIDWIQKAAAAVSP